jgi:hypothetical protein
VFNISPSRITDLHLYLPAHYSGSAETLSYLLQSEFFPDLTTLHLTLDAQYGVSASLMSWEWPLQGAEKLERVHVSLLKTEGMESLNTIRQIFQPTRAGSTLTIVMEW